MACTKIRDERINGRTKANQYAPPTFSKLGHNKIISQAIVDTTSLQIIFMPPTSRKLEGHIASGSFVRPWVRALRFLMHSITSEPSLLRFLKFHIWIPHYKKKADMYFSSYQDYAPFLSYGPLKKSEWNIVSKISQKLLKLEPWNLRNRLVALSRWTE